MLDKIIGNVSLFSVFFSFSYLLISLFFVFVLTKVMFYKFPEYFEQIRHGNISASIIFSTCIISFALMQSLCITHKHVPVMLILISLVSSLVLLISYLLAFNFFRDFIEEAINNNNIAVSILVSSLLLVIGILIGSALP